MIRRSAFALAVLTSVAWGRPEPVVREYRLPAYPAPTQGCHDTARRLGEAFAAATGTELVAALCSTERGASRPDIVIRYRAESLVVAVSTAEGAATALASPGRYRSEPDCEKALSNKTLEFEEATGLRATFSYCYLDAVGRRSPWALRLDGFGEARLKPFLSSYAMFGVPKNVKAGELGQALREALASRNAVLSDVVAHSNLAYADVAVHYYATKKLKFELKEYTKTAKLEECESQLADVRAAFATTNNPAAIAYCGYVHVGGQYEATALFVESPALQPRLSLETFNSHASCETGRPELTRYYQQTLKLDVRGSACTRHEASYRVVLFEMRPK